MRKTFSFWRLAFFISIIIWGNVQYASGTGPSHGSIRIVPITYNDHQTILFKTRYSFNYTGVYLPMKTEYGWLVVSSKGHWEEHPHMTFDPIYFPDESRMFEEYNTLETEFNTPFNWVSPPTSVQPLLRKYTFQQRSITPTYQEETIIVSLQEMLNTCVECEKRLRSLHNLLARITEHDTLKIKFYHEGVVLLENVDTEDQRIGATFDIPYFMDIEGIIRDYGIDNKSVDGIIILSQPVNWLHFHVSAIYFFKPFIRLLDGEVRHVVCIETPTTSYQTCVKQTLQILDIQGTVVTEGDYIYLLLREEELIPFFRKISTSESPFTQESITFERLPKWLHVVNEEGRVLRYNESQHVASETSRVPSLREIEQVFLRRQSK